MNQTLAVNPKPFTPEELLNIQLARRSFLAFLKFIFPASFEGEEFPMADGKRHPFSLSRIHYIWGSILERKARVSIMAPRMHLKSTVCNHAFSMWQLFKAGAFIDGIIFSYTQDLAQSHVEILKRLIKQNTYCRFWADRNAQAKSVIDFEVVFGSQFDEQSWIGKVDPAGIMSAKRGLHPKFVVADDILSDFANPLEPKVLRRIDEIFNQVVQSLPMVDDPLVVVGTPQSYEDTMYRLRGNEEFWWGRFPAEYWPSGTEGEGQVRVAWPERFSYRILQRVRRRILNRAYQVEYMLIPFLAVNSRLPKDVVLSCVDASLKSSSLDKPFKNPDNLPTFLGMDIGKEVHPTHISVFMRMHDGTLVQVFQVFFDGMPYNKQAVLLNRVVEHFDITRGYYDKTRAELDDRGITSRVIGRNFSRSLKANIALLLERRVYAELEEPGIVFLPDQRQVNQICSVTMDLKSVETSEGHGDSFWSNALAVRAAEDGAGATVLGDVNELFASRQRRAPQLA